MKQIKKAALIVATIMIMAMVWGKPLEAGEMKMVSLSTLRQPTEPVELTVEYLQAEETEWQFEPLSEFPLDPEMQIYMYEICEENNLSFAFAAMVMESETHFNPVAVGDGGESVGYFQINEVNWERMATEYGLDVHDPKDNIACGVVMLRELFEKYEDSYLVLLAYKCGESRGLDLYEQGVYTTIQFDCEELCNRAIEIEGYMGIL